jgi:Cu/Zn superoxide dismutase
MKKSLLIAAPSIAMGIAVMAMPGIASAADSSSYQAQLNALNGSGASGTVMLQLSGDQLTVTEKVSGLAETFNGAPYPHVQHIHIGAKGECPTPAADTDGDGVISTTEGGPSYGAIGTTLSTSGDTSPAAGTTLDVAPSGGSYDYDRTFTVDPATLDSLKAGTAVVVVHGLDPATLPAAAQSKPSDLVPSLPLAATSPALCGTLTASQMGAMPSGAAATGGGSTAGVEDQGLLVLGGGLLAAGAVAGGLALRRRSSVQA